LHGRSGGGAAIYGMGEDGQHSTGVTTTLTDKGANQGKQLFLIVSLSLNVLGEKNGSTEHSKGNKTVPEKVATTRTENGQK